MAKKQRMNGAGAGAHTDAPLQLTPIDQWAEETERVRLPSGRVVELRRPDVIDLVAGGSGEAPDLLSNLVLGMINNKKREVEITAETFPQVIAAMNLIVKVSFVYPRLVEGEAQGADEVPLARVSFNDKSFVFAWALGAHYQAAESFRPGPAGDVESVPGVQDVPQIPGGDIRDTQE